MKKTNYMLPTITFFDLSLSTELCSDCVLQARHGEYVCPLIIEDYPYTLINRENCESYAPELTDFICYHVPLEDSNVFTS